MSSSKNATVPHIPKWKLVLVIKELLKDDNKHEQMKPTKGGKKPRPPKSIKEKEICFRDGDNFEERESNLADGRSFSQRMLTLARHVCTTQRWDSLAKVMTAFVRLTQHYPIVVWKVGSLALANHCDSNDQLIQFFAKGVARLGKDAILTIILDYVNYLISIDKFSEASFFLETHKKKALKQPATKVIAVLQGYHGLLEYIKWFKKKCSENSDVEFSDAPKITRPARALKFLREALCTEGNCDLFVSKLYEILDYYDSVKELEEVLQSYIKINPTHPSPYIFMYDFLVKRYPDDNSRQISTLKELLDHCPSDYHAVVLCKLLPNKEFNAKVKILMNLVDYPEWRNNFDIWKFLATLLEGSADRVHRSTRNILQDRESWWPNYHFNCKTIIIDDAEKAQLVTYKAIVLSIIYPKEEEYVQQVKKLLKMGEWASEHKILRKALSKIK